MTWDAREKQTTKYTWDKPRVNANIQKKVDREGQAAEGVKEKGKI